MTASESPVQQVCQQQIDPLEFFAMLLWFDGRPLLDVIEPYRQQTLHKALYTFRHDGSPLYRRVLNGRAKKNFKTTIKIMLDNFSSKNPEENKEQFLRHYFGKKSEEYSKLFKCIQMSQEFYKQIFSIGVFKKDFLQASEVFPAMFNFYWLMMHFYAQFLLEIIEHPYIVVT